MALQTNATLIENLIDPEVFADYVDSKLTDAVKFAPLAKVYRDLEGRPGGTLSVPSYGYIGDATDVDEGDDIGIGKLTAAAKEIVIKKAGRGVQLTDESVLYSLGDPISEAGDQIVVAIAAAIEKDFLATLGTATLTSANTGKLTSAAINTALIQFGEDFEGEKVIFVSPTQHANLLNDEAWVKATDIGVEHLIKGAVGMISGCQVIVSNRITTTNYIVKAGALGLALKRGVQIEADRDIINKSTVITGDEHYGTWILNEKGVIKLTNTVA